MAWRSLMLALLSLAASFSAGTAPAHAYLATGISTGFGHACGLTTAGGVRCWGRNDYGQLGDGTTVNSSIPVDVDGLDSGVSAVAVDAYHSCALMTLGTVKCWGRNTWGQLGDGTTDDSPVPVDVSGLTDVGEISVGAWFSCALTTAGGVKCWGSDDYGALGDDVDAPNSYSATPVDVSGLTSGVAQISSGGVHTCAVTTAGGAKCWGSGQYGELGDGTTTTRYMPVDVVGLSSGVATISARAAANTCALMTSGGVKCWGYNFYGQLGDGTTTDSWTPVDVQGLSSGVDAMSIGDEHVCVLTDAGGLKCWGFNGWGELGDGTQTNRDAPVDVLSLTTGVVAMSLIEDYTCAITTDGILRCWGDGEFGELGDGTGQDHHTPNRVYGFGPPTLQTHHVPDGLVGWSVSTPVTETISAVDWSGHGLAGGPSCTLDGSPVLVSGSGPWTFPVSGEGAHEVSCSVSDNDGVSASASDSLMIDTAKPVSTLTFPSNGATLRPKRYLAGCSTPTVADICGTVSDIGGSGVLGVKVEIQRKDGDYWNGSSWQRHPIWKKAPGKANWRYRFAPSPGTYTVRSKATDIAGNVEVAGNGDTFVVRKPA